AAQQTKQTSQSNQLNHRTAPPAAQQMMQMFNKQNNFGLTTALQTCKARSGSPAAEADVTRQPTESSHSASGGPAHDKHVVKQIIIAQSARRHPSRRSIRHTATN
ncbi:unnamed protein product, partial [Polarella glacialis]